MKYFSKLPTVTYNGKAARNILSRARLSDETKNNSYTFYPYTVQDEDRVDILSHMYYDNSDYMWMIWMANDVIDPYYDMPLSTNDFDSYIIKKYGSVLEAQQRIQYWRNDWSFDESILTSAQYEALYVGDNVNGQYVNLKKYYDPQLDIFLKVSGYTRKQVDWISNTNRMSTFAITPTSGQFVVGERVQRNADNYGFIANVTSTMMTIQHIEGTFANGNTLTASKSGAVATISSVPYTVVNIPPEEEGFWSPITAYQWEEETNGYKKEIRLINNSYKQGIEEELKRVMM
jgi:hypothetical protein